MSELAALVEYWFGIGALRYSGRCLESLCDGLDLILLGRWGFRLDVFLLDHDHFIRRVWSFSAGLLVFVGS